MPSKGPAIGDVAPHNTALIEEDVQAALRYFRSIGARFGYDTKVVSVNLLPHVEDSRKPTRSDREGLLGQLIMKRLEAVLAALRKPVRLQ